MEVTKRLAVRHHVDAYALSSSNHDFADIRPFVVNNHITPFQPSPLLNSPFGRLNQVLRLRDLERTKRTARHIAERIDDGGYDVVLVHPCQVEQGPSVLRHLRTPTVYYCHEPLRALYEAIPPRPYDDSAIPRRRIFNRFDPFPGLYSRLLRKGDQINTRSASSVLVNSRFMARVVSEVYGVKTELSYLGVDVEQFRPLPNERRELVLSVGSLTPLKGFDFVIRAMAHYAGKPRPQLVIASNFQNPPERAYLEGVARENGVDVTLRGGVSDQELVQLYNQAQVVVCGQVREPFGLVPLEAMSCAAPVVAVSEGGLAESVVHQQTGLLVDRDPRRFAAAVQTLVEDVDLARQYGEEARNHVVRHWSWEAAVSVQEAHLKAAANGKSAARR